jgi:hypothetical protein
MRSPEGETAHTAQKMLPYPSRFQPRFSAHETKNPNYLPFHRLPAINHFSAPHLFRRDGSPRAHSTQSCPLPGLTHQEVYNYAS